MASVWRIFARNWLPSPSPFDAPATRPAMSTNSIVVGITFSGETMLASLSSLGSGIGTMPEFGSIVQNGKFSAPTPARVNALNSVDLPTLGKPTIPQLNPMILSLDGNQPVGYTLCSCCMANCQSPVTAHGMVAMASSIQFSISSRSLAETFPST